jgi:hypothetical protein
MAPSREGQATITERLDLSCEQAGRDLSSPALSDSATLQPYPTHPSRIAESFTPGPVNSIAAVMERIVYSRDVFLAAEKGVHRALYETFPVLYDIGMRLAADAALFEEFRNHPSWREHPGRKPKVGDQKRALHFVVMKAYGGARSANQRASLFAAALQCLAQDGVAAETLIETIEDRGGLKVLAREMAVRRRQHKLPGGATSTSVLPPLTGQEEVSVLAPASLAARLRGLRLYVAEAPDGSLTLSMHPTQLVPVFPAAPIPRLMPPLTCPSTPLQANESLMLVKHLQVGDRAVPVLRQRRLIKRSAAQPPQSSHSPD